MIPSRGLEEVGMLGLHRLHALLVQLRTRPCPCSVRTEESSSRQLVQSDMLVEPFPLWPQRPEYLPGLSLGLWGS